MILSEIYEIFDCLFKGSGTTTGWYGNVELDNNRVKWTVPASDKYAGCNNATILADAVGKTITIAVRVESERNLRLTCFYYSGGTWSQINGVFIAAGENDLITLQSTVPANATRVWCRLQSNSSSDVLAQGDIIYIDEFYIYIG